MSALLALLLLGARETIGVYGGWGAFRDDSPARCFAIAQPVDPTQRAGSLSIATWPDRNVRSQLYVHLSRPRAGTARVTLSIGERRFDLIANDTDAWAPDARTDAAIVAAMRSSRSLSVEALGRGGAPFADTYALSGAASAIDSAALACRR
ncbi:hypothetical protein FPZ24_00755 [Sphingomonas panacisoli]|uniref:Uncharacterized protein n=1 Tax=Sphingomonas panacisoli TaxID=1813879 RepID=A0A5B8LDG5_9SPHN|nr:hypothetical protein [Sphingomonas panacisoli]QDZ06181.1 hypothetical protein FPZ24_00755 [Sphingomonas panacisoli]